MPEGLDGSANRTASSYNEAMDALSSLITRRSRADASNEGDRFDLMFDYLEMLDLEESVSKMNVIHVAGTKGKGSTCKFAESILRNCGFHTGLFTSPHLIDVRERFQLDGLDVCEDKFLEYFWWCWNRLKLIGVVYFNPSREIDRNYFVAYLMMDTFEEGPYEKTSENKPMPAYFRFLALLAFKIFAGEQVDVAILEVGLGGKFDATNVVQRPIVCGIASLGYDHMEILGNTLGEIAGEKAGIFKQGVPAFTVPQPDDAMRVLEEKASQLDVHLQVVSPLDVNLLHGQHLGLEGEHQYLNAGLAIELCSTWLQRTGHMEVNYLDQTSPLPEEFLRGLTTATLQGRAQIISDQFIDIESPGDLVFYLDGAHSPESMEVCAKWFCHAINEDKKQQNSNNQQTDNSSTSLDLVHGYGCETPRKSSTQILLFNCMPVRDPQLLLPRLVKTCANHGVHFEKALFAPNLSLHNKVSSSALAPNDLRVGLSWQWSLQKVWENLINKERGRNARNAAIICKDGKEDKEMHAGSFKNSEVFPSLPLAIKWLRDTVQQNRSAHFQVLVTGSLHLIGDVLRLVKK